MHLAKRYAPRATIFANGGLHNVEQAVAALDDGADKAQPLRGLLQQDAAQALTNECFSALHNARMP